MEVIAPPPTAAPRIAATEDVGALPLFQLYAEHTGMTQQAAQAGCTILEVRRALPYQPLTCVPSYVLLSSRACRLSSRSHRFGAGGVSGMCIKHRMPALSCTAHSLG